MKIDFIIGSLFAGGAERVVSLLANHFANNGHNVRVITFRGGNHYELHPSIERVHGTHKQLILNYTICRAFFFLAKFYSKKENHPDIISSHIGLMGYATIPISKIYNIKITVTEHFNHYNRPMTIQKWILWNILYKFPDALTVLTKFDLPFFKSKTKLVKVILNPSSFTPMSNLKIEREKVLLAVGDLDRYKHKGFDNLLDIVEKPLLNNPEWTLKIIGKGDIGLKFLKTKLEKLKSRDQVIFTGYRNDIQEIMSKSEIFILSSRHEGLPMVLIEAMSQGMVCLSYNCISGPSDIITNNFDGVLIEDQNKEQMTLKLNELMQDEKLRYSLRQKSVTKLDKFAIENVGKEWLDLFEKILN